MSKCGAKTACYNNHLISGGAEMKARAFLEHVRHVPVCGGSLPKFMLCPHPMHVPIRSGHDVLPLIASPLLSTFASVDRHSVSYLVYVYGVYIARGQVTSYVTTTLLAWHVAVLNWIEREANRYYSSSTKIMLF